MQVLKGSFDSIPELIPVLAAVAQDRELPFDVTDTTRLLLTALEFEGLFVAVSDDDVVGVGVVLPVQAYSDAEDWRLVEYVWNADPRLPEATQARALIMLLDSFEAHARLVQLPLHITISATDRAGAMPQALERRGFEAHEIVFKKGA